MEAETRAHPLRSDSRGAGQPRAPGLRPTSNACASAWGGSASEWYARPRSPASRSADNQTDQPRSARLGGHPHSRAHLRPSVPVRPRARCGLHWRPRVAHHHAPHWRDHPGTRPPGALFFDSLHRMTELADVSYCSPRPRPSFRRCWPAAPCTISEHHEERLDIIRRRRSRPPQRHRQRIHEAFFSPSGPGEDMAESETYAHLEHLRELGELTERWTDDRVRIVTAHYHARPDSICTWATKRATSRATRFNSLDSPRDGWSSGLCTSPRRRAPPAHGTKTEEDGNVGGPRPGFRRREQKGHVNDAVHDTSSTSRSITCPSARSRPRVHGTAGTAERHHRRGHRRSSPTTSG